MTAYFFDTETTSREDDRQIIEAALLPAPSVDDMLGSNDRLPLPFANLILSETLWEQRFKPSCELELGALAVHHILPHELADCPPSSSFKLPEDASYVIGHNVDFDWKAAGAPVVVKRIDTCAIARHVWPDSTAHGQSALLYLTLGATDLTRERLKKAHSAGADVLNNVLLLDEIIAEAPVPLTTWTELYAYSEACRIPLRMPIGEKQGLKGLKLDEAVDVDPGFVDWCLRQDWIDDYLRKGLEQAIERSQEKRRARFR
jgi:exodeoxyribonuclease X